MQKNKSLVAAFLLGDTEDLSASELEAFRSMGLMHLFAVSGLNIALLFALLYIPFRLIGQKAIGTALGYTVAVLFLLLLDFPVPLLRAWVFMTIALFMRVLDRRIPSWTSLFLTAIFVEILFPLSTFSMSFILSFGVTAAIFIFYEPFYFCFASSKKYLKLWNEHLALTLAAGLPALLLTYFLFGQANPLSLLYNLLLVPFSGIYLFAALIFLFFDPAQYIFLPLDTLYLEFAEWHQTYISANFPLADKTAQQISLAFVATLLLLLYITKIRRRLWSAKRFVRVVIPLLVVILLLPYFLVEYPKNAFYAIPNKVWIYSDAQLTTVGASVFSPPPKEPKICFPVHHRHEIALDKRMPKEILQHGNACYIFSGRMQPEKWRSHILKPCSQLYLLHGKDVTPNVAEWKSLFVLFGYSGAVALRNYFKWYGDGIVDCM
ncbi:MAG TPA: ComEC/Rec2 family competence protein [Turneriella sp.]|nr:ComEC/Rec2 family competence protein [Turneriella sp.]